MGGYYTKSVEESLAPPRVKKRCLGENNIDCNCTTHRKRFFLVRMAPMRYAPPEVQARRQSDQDAMLRAKREWDVK